MKNLIYILICLFFAASAENLIEKETIYTGTVTIYDEGKGFGYIEINEFRNEEAFFIDDFTIDDVQKGDKVNFMIRNTRKGYYAFEIKLR